LIKKKASNSIGSYTFNENNFEPNQVISTLKFANSYFSRLKGLMFKSKLDYVLVLKPAKSKHKIFSSIHTLFMKLTIDLVFLDKNKKVVETSQISPWKFYTPKRSVDYILEMKKGSIEKYEIAIGDKLDFVCEFR